MAAQWPLGPWPFEVGARGWREGWAAHVHQCLLATEFWRAVDPNSTLQFLAFLVVVYTLGGDVMQKVYTKSFYTPRHPCARASPCLVVVYIYRAWMKETVYQKTHILGVATTTAAATAEEFPVPARPHPITQGHHIPFGSPPPEEG